MCVCVGGGLSLVRLAYNSVEIKGSTEVQCVVLAEQKLVPHSLLLPYLNRFVKNRVAVRRGGGVSVPFGRQDQRGGPVVLKLTTTEADRAPVDSSNMGSGKDTQPFLPPWGTQLRGYNGISAMTLPGHRPNIGYSVSFLRVEKKSVLSDFSRSGITFVLLLCGFNSD